MGTKLYILYCGWKYIIHVLLYKMYEQMNIVTELQAYTIKVVMSSWGHGMVISHLKLSKSLSSFGSRVNHFRFSSKHHQLAKFMNGDDAV